MLVSCETNKNETRPGNEEQVVRPTTPIDDRRHVFELIDSALVLGDEKAYNKVSSYYFVANRQREFFYFALTMANEKKSVEAHFHVYSIIAYSTSELPQKALMKMDCKTRNMALYYLLKSYEIGYDRAKYYIEEFFGKDVAIPKSSTYLQKFCTD